VVSDRVLLRSIVQNFLSNAVRYTQRGGIVVGVRRRGGTAQIVVFDTGPGIASKDRARIFREFERVGTREEAGIGLGLAIVERTARLLDARIEVDSVPGRGSRFSVSLPLAAPTEDVVPAEVPGTDTIVLPSLRVIVVDDAAEVRTATLAFLHARGHRAVAAADVEGALQLRGTWDVALLDYDLDGPIDGIMLAQKLRETRPGIRIALVTADRTPDVARRAQQAGLVLLSKPLDPQALRRWLAKGFAIAG
jgi:CheY-like chemotaxis protein